MLAHRSNALVLLGLSVPAAFGLRSLSNDAIWLHLALGRQIATHGIPQADQLTFSRAGAPWLDWSWLYNLLVYRLWSLGQAPLLILVHVLAVLGAVALLLPVARRYASPAALCLALLYFGWCMAPVFVPGPETFSLLFAAAFMALLAGVSRPRARIAALLVLQCVWTQIHPSFLLGPLLCLLFAVGGDDAEAGTPARRPWSLLLPATACLVTVLNPYGLGLHRAVAVTWGRLGATQVRTWISPFHWQFSTPLLDQVVTAGLVLGALGIMTYRKRLPLALTSSAVFAAAVAVLRPRMHQEWFALLAFPFLALSAQALAEYLRSGWPKGPFLVKGSRLLLAALCLLSLAGVLTNQYYNIVGSPSSCGLGVEYDMLPEAASEIIAREDFPERLVHLAADGGYLAWRHPGRRVFIDQRADLFGSALFVELSSALTGSEAALDAFEARWEPGGFLINCCFPNAALGVRNLLKHDRWALVYFDGTTAIVVRRMDRYASLFREQALQTSGLQILERERRDFLARASSLIKPPASPRLVGAASLFIDLEKFREGAAVHAALARGTRNMPPAWIGLGFCQFHLGEADAAVQSLAYATRRFPRNVKAWLWLSRAAAAAGDAAAAEAAFNRARKLDAPLAARFGNPLEDPDAPPRKAPFIPRGPAGAL